MRYYSVAFILRSIVIGGAMMLSTDILFAAIITVVFFADNN